MSTEVVSRDGSRIGGAKAAAAFPRDPARIAQLIDGSLATARACRPVRVMLKTVAEPLGIPESTANVHALIHARAVVDAAALVMVAGFVGRVPNAMRALACLLLASGDGYGYGMSASVAATMSLSQAAGAPYLGRLSARVSQRAVILGGLAIHVVAGACLVAALATERVAVPRLFVVAAVFGASVVPLGSLVRARWASIVDGALRMRAYSYEATVDELIYIVGPLLVTAISVGAFPASGIVVSPPLALTGGLALARHVSTEPKRVTSERAPEWVLRLLGAKPTLLVCVGLGGWFEALRPPSDTMSPSTRLSGVWSQACDSSACCLRTVRFDSFVRAASLIPA